MKRYIVKVKMYPSVESIMWITKHTNKRIIDIERDTHTTITLIKERKNEHFIIEGQYRDAHQARIIIQSLEKEYYRGLNNKESTTTTSTSTSLYLKNYKSKNKN
jgi:hypothetical protein